MATTSSNHKPWVPPTGRHQVNIGSSFNRALKARKLKDAPTPPPPKRSNLPQHDFYALRYSHKPATVDYVKPASIEVKKGAEHATIVAEIPSTQAGESHQFSGHERVAGEVDCVLIFDEATGQFTLEKVDSTLSLKFIKTMAAARSPLPASSPSPPLASVISKKPPTASSSATAFKKQDIPIDPELYRELLQGDEEDGEVVEPPRLPPHRGTKQEVDDDEMLLSLAQPSPPPPSRPSTSAQSKPRPAKAVPKQRPEVQPAPSIPTATPVPPTQSRPGAKLPPKPTTALASSSSRPTQSPAPRALGSSSTTHTKSPSLTSVSSSAPTAKTRQPNAPAPQPGAKAKKPGKRPSDASIDSALADAVDPPRPTKKSRPLIPPKKKEPSPPPRAASPLAFPGGAGTYAPPPPLPGAKPPGPSRAGGTSGLSSNPPAPSAKVSKPPPKPPVPEPQPTRLALPTPVVPAADDSDDDWVEATPAQAPPPVAPFIIMEEEDPSLEPPTHRPPIFMEEVDGNDLDDGSMFGSNHGEVEPDALPVDDEDDDEDMEPVAVDDELHRELLMQMEGQMESQADGYEEDEEEDFLSAAMMTQPVPTGKPLSLNAYAGGANDDNSDEYTSTDDESDDD